MSLMDDTQQNIQTRLDCSGAPTGETREAGRAETESSEATNGRKSPASTDRLMEEVCERENLKEALRRVKANKGSAGVDGMTIGGLTNYLKQHWPAIRERLLNGTYEPKPVRRVEIRKPDGGECQSAASPPCWIDSSSRRCYRCCNEGGIGRSRHTATGFDRDSRRVTPWHRRSTTSPKAVNYDKLMGRIAQRVDEKRHAVAGLLYKPGLDQAAAMQ